MEPTSRTYERVIQYVLSQPWAIRVNELVVIQEILRLRAAGLKFTAEEIAERIGTPQARNAPESKGSGAVAVVPVWGVIGHRANELRAVSSGIGTSTEVLGAQISTLGADPNVKAIVLDINSPGGGVFGLPEVAADIRAARAKKPVIAVANALMASGAYWIGASASEIVVTPSSLSGSIGVYSVHQDMSQRLTKEGVAVTLIRAGKYKIEDNPFGPLTDEARAAMQAQVDAYYAMFTTDVAKGRNVAVETVRKGFGEGRVLGAKDAVRLGMADRIGTLEEVIADAASGREPQKEAASVIDIEDMASAATAMEPEPVVEEAAAEEAADPMDLRLRLLRRRQLGLPPV